MAVPKAERAFHRRTAVRCFNDTWGFLEKKDRDPDAGEEMLHLAHASRFHWGIVGTPKNQAVGDWQLSRVYAALDGPRLALHFAHSSLELCQRNRLSEMVHIGYEAMARAHAVVEDYPSARRYLRKAREHREMSSADDEDRKVYLDQIRETEKMLGRSRVRRVRNQPSGRWGRGRTEWMSSLPMSVSRC